MKDPVKVVAAADERRRKTAAGRRLFRAYGAEKDEVCYSLSEEERAVLADAMDGWRAGSMNVAASALEKLTGESVERPFAEEPEPEPAETQGKLL